MASFYKLFKDIPYPEKSIYEIIIAFYDDMKKHEGDINQAAIQAEIITIVSEQLIKIIEDR